MAAVLIFGGIIFFHELGHMLTAKAAGVRVYEFAVGMGPAIFKHEKNGTVYSIRLLPLGGFTMLEGEDEASDSPDSLSKKPLPARLAVFAAGSVFNLVLGYVILVILTAMNGYVGTTYVVDFTENSVSAGQLQVGDRILRVNGHRVMTSNDISYEFLRDADGLVELEVERNGERQTLNIQFTLEDYGDGVNAIDIDFRVAAVKAQLSDYFTYPINWSFSLMKQVWGSLIDLIGGRYQVNQLSGPVGVVSAIGEASKLGLDSVLLMAAFLAINIGIFNLLPFPILDGGKIVITIIESIAGRPINTRVMEWIMTGSVALIVLLMIYVTANDIFRLIE